MSDPLRLFFWTQVCASRLRRRADQDLATHADLTAAQLGALFVIGQADGCLLKDLAAGLHVNGSAITTLTTRLEKRGYVERRRSERDGRAFCLHLTDAGRRAKALAAPRLKAMNDWLADGFTPQELATVSRFLQTAAARATAAPVGDSQTKSSPHE